MGDHGTERSSLPWSLRLVRASAIPRGFRHSTFRGPESASLLSPRLARVWQPISPGISGLIDASAPCQADSAAGEGTTLLIQTRTPASWHAIIIVAVQIRNGELDERFHHA